MSDDRDLVARLREVDNRLAAIQPSPFLQTQLRAKLRDEEERRAQPALRRIGRPALVVAMAAGVIGILLSSLPGSRLARVGSPVRVVNGAASADDSAQAVENTDAGPPSPSSPSRRAPKRGPLLLEAPVFQRGRELAPDAPTPKPPTRWAQRLESSHESFVLSVGADHVVHFDSTGARTGSGAGNLITSERSIVTGTTTQGVMANTPSTAATTATTTTGRAVPTTPSTITSPSPSGAPNAKPQPTNKPADPTGSRDPSHACQSVDQLRDVAYAECKQKGADVSSFSPLEPCGDGTFGSAKVVCGSPPSPTQSCPSGSLNNLPCLDDGSLMNIVASACAGTGYGVSMFTPSLDCPSGGSSVVKWECECAPPQDPNYPNDPTTGSDGCIEQIVGDPNQCAFQGDLISQGIDLCASMQMQLNDAVAASDCGGELSTIAKILCCPIKLFREQETLHPLSEETF
ncbi:MAG: hypothetical protein U0165_03660 [Polyangiaceae bacterium]